MQTLERVFTGKNSDLTESDPLQAAVELDGELYADPELTCLSESELEQRAIDNKKAAEDALTECCRDVVEYVRRAGDTRPGRAQAIRAYAHATGFGQWQVYELLAIGRYVPPILREQYPTLEYGHLREAVKHTSRKGETDAERQGRIIRVLDISADENLLPTKTRALAMEIDRQEPERQEPAPPVEAVTEPPPRTMDRFQRLDVRDAPASPPAPVMDTAEVDALRVRVAELEAENARLRDLNAAVATENARLREGPTPPPMLAFEPTALLHGFRDGLCLEWVKLHGGDVRLETLSHLAQIAENRLRRLLEARG